MEGKESIDALFRYATEGILVVNEAGEIVRINPSAEKLFGYGPDELVGCRVEKLIPGRFGTKHVSHREKYFNTPNARAMGLGMELYGLKKEGTEFPVEISLSPYSASEGRFVIAFIVDITVRKESEEQLKNYSVELEKQVRNRTLVLEEAIEELERTKHELHNALEKEKELNELKSRFVSIASHEFRTPLTTMMSSLSLIAKYAEQGDTANQDRHIQKIRSAIGNLTDILNDFLSLSKLEEGKIENMTEDMDLREFLADIIVDFQPLLKTGQMIGFEYTGSEVVKLDKKLLKNVIFNLISNAIKFSPEGSVIEISCEVDEEITITVSDQGIGIPKADQRHLFERFHRGQNATHVQGTGLGLNIVLKYLELMGGIIFYESEENEGTMFTVKLPA